MSFCGYLALEIISIAKYGSWRFQGLSFTNTGTTIEDSAQGPGKEGRYLSLGKNLFVSVQKCLRQNSSNISDHDPSGKDLSLYCIVIFPISEMECFIVSDLGEGGEETNV